MQVIVDDLLVQYELSGKGKLVLLLHGWGDSLQGLKQMQQNLSQDYQVLSVDLPGFGASSMPKGAWNLDDYGRFLQSLLLKLKLQQPYAVIGHSNGGALAIRSIRLEYLQPKRLVLLAASGVRTGSQKKRFTLKIIAKAGNVATFWLPSRYRAALRRGLYGAAGSDMLVAPHLQETFRRTVRQDVQADAATLRLPVLLLYADEDKAVPLQDAKTYQRIIKNAKLIVIPGAGHFLHLEKFAQVIEPIREFLHD